MSLKFYANVYRNLLSWILEVLKAMAVIIIYIFALQEYYENVIYRICR